MIDTQLKIHDNYSLEFKIGFITSKNLKEENNGFKINTWLFVPNSLDLNRSTYNKELFYRDVKTNIRLITPIYSLEDILKVGKGPLPRLQNAIDELIVNPSDAVKTENYLYQVKMLLCIMKSALRREAQIINSIADSEAAILYIKKSVQQIKDIAAEYREKWDGLVKPGITKQQQEYFQFGDDFLGNIIEQYTFEIMRKLEGTIVLERSMPELSKLIEEESEHKKKKGFMLLKVGNDKHNSLVIAQRNILKKFVESDLFLQIIKKKDGAFAEQFYYSVAAGTAMIFATVISFFATQRFGNFTTDLFIILVVSYMLKDRIKDLMRYYFSSELSKKYYDKKLNLSIRNREIGWLKESFDFIDENKLPEEVKIIRARTPIVEAENQVYDEKIILYRKWVNLSKTELEKYKEYRLAGINDITRLNLFSFTQKMDNPSIPLYYPDKEKGYINFEGTKVYPLYFIIKCESAQEIYYKKYRVLLNRNGITDVSELIN